MQVSIRSLPWRPACAGKAGVPRSWPKRAILIGMTALATSGCDRRTDYRFRMSVEVMTLEGLRTGSSFMEVGAKTIRSLFAEEPAGSAIFALLAMDSYNRGYDQGVTLTFGETDGVAAGTRILGNAVLAHDVVS